MAPYERAEYVGEFLQGIVNRNIKMSKWDLFKQKKTKTDKYMNLTARAHFSSLEPELSFLSVI